MNKFTIALIGIILILCGKKSPNSSIIENKISSENTIAHITKLASDEYQVRFTATVGEKKL